MAQFSVLASRCVQAAQRCISSSPSCCSWWSVDALMCVSSKHYIAAACRLLAGACRRRLLLPLFVIKQHFVHIYLSLPCMAVTCSLCLSRPCEQQHRPTSAMHSSSSSWPSLGAAPAAGGISPRRQQQQQPRSSSSSST